MSQPPFYAIDSESRRRKQATLNPHGKHFQKCCRTIIPSRPRCRPQTVYLDPGLIQLRSSLSVTTLEPPQSSITLIAQQSKAGQCRRSSLQQMSAAPDAQPSPTSPTPP